MEKRVQSRHLSPNSFIKNRRGQIHLSLGMIFSIILIIFFIAFAFYAIKNFLGLQNTVNISQFYNNLQNDVSTAWHSESSSQKYSYNLPISVSQVCFTNQSNDVVLYGNDGTPLGTGNIDYINIIAMTANGDDCFNVTSGKINFLLQKNLRESLVTIKNPD
ncbi:MAG: hypothetical protein KGH55_02715 [Nanoarchaeota archaeon]|nr:hypothetical protein [Nanoarchaeota archaeon]